MTAPLPAVPEREAFEAHFTSVERGDGDIPLPTPADGKRWDAYVGRRQIALGAWIAGQAHMASMVRGSLEIGLENTVFMAAVARDTYGAYPSISSLGRRLTAADADVATVRAALDLCNGAPSTDCWLSVERDGLPQCDGVEVWIGENEAGYVGAFNGVTDSGVCSMCTAEDAVMVMSGLRYYRRHISPANERVTAEMGVAG